MAMKSPIFIRTLSKDERERLEAGLRSKDAFTLRRSQMLWASSRREHAPRIARNLGCGAQTARDAIHDFNARSTYEYVQSLRELCEISTNFVKLTATPVNSYRLLSTLIKLYNSFQRRQ
jgi:hypothetical protein